MSTVSIRTVSELTRVETTISTARSSSGMTILHHAVDSKNFETIAVIVKHLNGEKDQSIRKFEMNREVGPHKWTPLYRAGRSSIPLSLSLSLSLFTSARLAVIHDCQKDIIELLLSNGGNAQCEDRSLGTSALQMAVIKGNLATTQLLVNYGANTRALSKVRTRTARLTFILSLSLVAGRGKHAAAIGVVDE